MVNGKGQWQQSAWLRHNSICTRTIKFGFIKAGRIKSKSIFIATSFQRLYGTVRMLFGMDHVYCTAHGWNDSILEAIKNY